jgi:uncharacterized protein YoxC
MDQKQVIINIFFFVISISFIYWIVQINKILALYREMMREMHKFNMELSKDIQQLYKCYAGLLEHVNNISNNREEDNEK